MHPPPYSVDPQYWLSCPNLGVHANLVENVPLISCWADRVGKLEPDDRGDRACDLFFLHGTLIDLQASSTAPGEKNSYAHSTITPQQRAFLSAQMSCFSHIATCYAPFYAQSTFSIPWGGAAEVEERTARAYCDVAAAFDAFLRFCGDERPFIMCGHSQVGVFKSRVSNEGSKQRWSCGSINQPIQLSGALARVRI